MQHGGQAYLEEVVVVPQCGHSEEERHQKDQTRDAAVSFEDVERNTEFLQSCQAMSRTAVSVDL